MNKLKFSDRLLLFFLALIMVLLGLAVLIFGLKYDSLVLRPEGQGFFTFNRILFLAASLLAIICGLFLLSLPFRLKQGKGSFVNLKTASGTLAISVQAIEAIIQKSLVKHEEIKLSHLSVTNTRGGLEVDVKATTAHNINIPLAVNQVQQLIRQQLNASLGLDAREVKVIIEKADLTANASQFLVQQEELSLPAQKDEENKMEDKAKGGN